MVLLAGVMAHTGLFALVGGGYTLGPLAPWILAFSSIFVGTLASLSEYEVWLQRLFWVLALVAGFLALPQAIEVSSTLLAEIPSAMQTVWLIVAVAPVPLGLVIGALKPWV